MTPDRWRQVSRIYGAAIAKPLDARNAFLAEVCADDTDLRRDVESLLREDAADAPIDDPIGDTTAAMLHEDLSGRTLGVFRLEALLGAGGMGQVYRATDTRLQRTVAIKVLPPSLAEDLQFRARFDREAKAIGALNHPHICTLHDVGREGAVSFLVMEHVEGETLAARLARGAVPFDQALTWTIEIADALAAAHKVGIIHRDLKPGNVMVTKGGTKLLDFGLAKSGAGTGAITSLSMLPTTPGGAIVPGAVPLTARGMILGTLQYMAPEQLESGSVDARTDIFAFGALAYELLTGKKAFEGKTQASLIAAIMAASPPAMTTMRPLTPAALERLVQTCLAKDPDDRWQSMRDVTRMLEEIESAPALPLSISNGAPLRSKRLPVVTLIGGLAAGALLATGLGTVSRRPLPLDALPSAPLVHFSFPAPNTTNGSSAFGGTPGSSAAILVPPLAVSPDGRWVAFAAASDDGFRLWVRSVESGETRPLPGTLNPRYPFWSADSRTVAFFTQGDLMAVDLAGTSARRLTPGFDNGVGGSWRADGTIVAAKADGFWLLHVDGRQPARLEVAQARMSEWRFPELLPDGQHMLAWNQEEAAVYALPLNGIVGVKVLDSERAARFVNGSLLFVRGQTAYAQPFDTRTLTLTGRPRPLALRVSSTTSGYVAMSASANGVFASASGERTPAQLAWVDRKGNQLERIGDPVTQNNIRLSGEQILVTRSDVNEKNATVVIDRARGGFTSRIAEGGNAIFSPDGQQVAYYGNRRGLFTKPITGNTATQIFDGAVWPTDWFRDGKALVVQSADLGRGMDLALIDLATHKVRPLVSTAANESGGVLSPDQRWIAYVSDESSRAEVYLVSLFDSNKRIAVSTAGGYTPRWRSDGKELFFLALDDQTLMSVQISWLNGVPQPSAPSELFRSEALVGSTARTFGGAFAPSPDGQRFLLAQLTKREAGVIDVLVNWPRALGE